MATKNVSNREKTLKSMLAMMDSDNFTIDKCIEYCFYGNKDYAIAFNFILTNYRDYFDEYLTTVDVPSEYYYQPGRFAEMYYGTADLDWLVLYFANMTSLFEFNKPTISILPKSRLLDINTLMVQYRAEVEEYYTNPARYIDEK